MKRNIESAVDQCLVWLREGRDMETCLSHYPEFAAELRPLLEVAAGVARIRLPASQADARAAGQQRMLAALAQKQASMARVHPVARFARQAGRFLLPGRPGSMRPAWQLVGMVLIIVLLAGGSVTVAASANSLPGDRLYPVKLAGQSARLALMFDPGRQQLLADQFETQRRQDVQTALSAGRRASVEFQGVLQQIEGALWVVGGLPVSLDETTTIVGQPYVGAAVRVRADLPGSGGMEASWLEIESTAMPEPTDTQQPTATPSPTETPEDIDTQAPTATPKATTILATAETPTPDTTSVEEQTPVLTETPEPEDTAEDEGVLEPTETPESDKDAAGEDGQALEPTGTPEPAGDAADEDGQAPDPTHSPEPDGDAADEDGQAPDPTHSPEPDEDAADEDGQAPDPTHSPEPDEDAAEDEQTPEPAGTSAPDDESSDEQAPEPDGTSEPDDAPDDEHTPEPDDTPDNEHTPEPTERPED